MFQSIRVVFLVSIMFASVSSVAARKVVDLNVQGLQADKGIPENQRVLLKFVGADNIINPNGTDEAEAVFLISNQKNLRLPENSRAVIRVNEILDNGSKRLVGNFTAKATSKKKNSLTRLMLNGLDQSGNQFEFTLLGENGKVTEVFTGTFFPDPAGLVISDVTPPNISNTFSEAQMIEIAKRLPNHMDMAMVPSKFDGIVPRVTEMGSRFDIHFRNVGKTVVSPVKARVIAVENQSETDGGTNANLVSGPAAQRPATAAPGTIYFATDTNQIFGNTTNVEGPLTLLTQATSSGGGGAGSPGPAGAPGAPGQNGSNGANCFDAPGITDQNNNGQLDVGDCIIFANNEPSIVTTNESRALPLNNTPVAFNTPINNIDGSNSIARRIAISNGIVLNNEAFVVGLNASGAPVNFQFPLINNGAITNFTTVPNSQANSFLIQDMLLRVYVQNNNLFLINVPAFVGGPFTQQSPNVVFSNQVLQ